MDLLTLKMYVKKKPWHFVSSPIDTPPSERTFGFFLCVLRCAILEILVDGIKSNTVSCPYQYASASASAHACPSAYVKCALTLAPSAQPGLRRGLPHPQLPPPRRSNALPPPAVPIRPAVPAAPAAAAPAGFKSSHGRPDQDDAAAAAVDVAAGAPAARILDLRQSSPLFTRAPRQGMWALRAKIYKAIISLLPLLLKT